MTLVRQRPTKPVGRIGRRLVFNWLDRAAVGRVERRFLGGAISYERGTSLKKKMPTPLGTFQVKVESVDWQWIGRRLVVGKASVGGGLGSQV